MWARSTIRAVAVVADSVWGAMEGRRMLNVTWDEGAEQGPEHCGRDGLAEASRLEKGCEPVFSGRYRPKLRVDTSLPSTHFPSWRTHPWNREIARPIFRGSKCELWAPTQVPQDCRDSVATAIGLDPDQVKVNVTLMGGGFGRRLEHDYAVEAALVSKAMNGPVKVIWTREDDMRFSTYRPASLHQLSATLDGSGIPVGLTHRIICAVHQRTEGTAGPEWR